MLKAASKTLRRGIEAPAAVFLGYLLVTLALTWPLAYQLRESLPSLDSDVLIALWGNWWFRQFLYFGQPLYFTRALFYPNGASLAAHSLSPLFSVMSAPLFPLLGERGSYNFATLAIFVLGAFGAYLLVLELTRRKGAAFIAGIVYAFAPYHLTHAIAHPTLGSTEWLPYLALCLIRMYTYKSFKYAVLAGLFLSLSVWSGLQLGLLATMWAGLFVLWMAVTQHEARDGKSIGNLAVVGAVTLLLALPAVLPILYEIGAHRESVWYLRSEEFIGQTDALAFFVPPRLNPLVGQQVAPLYERFIKNQQWMLYLGFAALALAIFGAVRARREVLFWWVSGLVWMVLALGIFLRVNGVTYESIPLPYTLVSGWFPFNTLGSADRFNLLVPLSLAVLVGYGLAYVQRARLVALAGALIVVEYMCVPIPMEPPQPLSGFIHRMAEDKNQYAVLDLPMGKFISRYWNYQQTIHGKPLVEGHISRTPLDAYEFIDSLPLLRAFQAGGKVRRQRAFADLCALSENGVRYILMHKDYATRAQVRQRQSNLPSPPIFEDVRLAVYGTGECANVR